MRQMLALLQVLSGTRPAFLPKPLVGGSCSGLAVAVGEHLTVYHRAASLKCQTLFIDLTILCYLQQATGKVIHFVWINPCNSTQGTPGDSSNSLCLLII